MNTEEQEESISKGIKIPQICSETDIPDDETPTSIGSFTHFLSPKFINGLSRRDKIKNFQRLKNQQTKFIHKTDKQKIEKNLNILPKNGDSSSLNSSLNSQNEEEKDTTKIENFRRGNIIELEINKKGTLTNKNSNLRLKNGNSPNKKFSKLTSLSNIFSHNQDSIEDNESNSEDSRKDFSLRSLNNASMTQYNWNQKFTEESFLENQLFLEDPDSGDKFISMILLPNGETKKIDKRDVLKEVKSGSGILKHLNERERRKKARLLEDISEKKERNQSFKRKDGKKRSSVKFGRMMKVYHFDPKNKVAVHEKSEKQKDS